MRTNHAGVKEVAHIRTNMENFGEGHKRVFGEPEKQFCDVCELRFSLCICIESEEDEGKKEESIGKI